MSMAEILLLHYSRLFNDAALGVEVIYRQTKCEDSHSWILYEKQWNKIEWQTHTWTDTKNNRQAWGLSDV
jgi:hypothetical protein